MTNAASCSCTGAKSIKLVGKVEREGYTLIPTAMYWSGNKVQLQLALAKATTSAPSRRTVIGADDAAAQQECLIAFAFVGAA